MGLALYAQNQTAEAISRTEEALVIFEAIESPNAVETRQTLAEWREQ
jgi:hypothetical protein